MNTSFNRRLFRQSLAAMALTVAALGLSTPPARSEPSVARLWDEEILAAIRIDLPHPPVHARNLFHFSAAMYDAWAAYDTQAVGYLYHGKHAAADVAAARRQAVSYAAYRILRERYSLSRGAATTLPTLERLMSSLGYDPGDLSQDVATPTGVGNRVAAVISAYALEDGARQTEGYADFPPDRFGYQSVNQPLIVTLPGIILFDVNRWQPLVITNGVTQNNIPVNAIQTFLGAQWLSVRPFCLDRDLTSRPWMDPGAPPHLGGPGDAEFRSNVVEVIRRSSELTPDDGVTLDISPGAWGNNHLGTNDGTGHPVNPATGQPYAPNLVRRGDFARVLAEFWADGPRSETPPGHWNFIANQVSDHPSFSKRLGGTGPVLDDLEWDVKLYFALNAALHDAACAAWSLKRYYDGWRPISAIRFQGELGQCTDPNRPHYNSKGLPLIPDLVELVTADSAKPGQRHAGIAPNTLVIRNWPGQPADPTNSYSGVRWITPGTWLPYQKKTFVTPAFPGYISGHSTFSRAAAEVMAAITGSDFFPGGMGGFTAPAGTFLSFEKGPSEAVSLQWGTYFDAADQAGLSRIWGGIHPPVDDLTGRRVGSTCGRAAWSLARSYFDGSVLTNEFGVSYRIVRTGRGEVRFPTQRGLTYLIQTASDPAGPFVNDPSGAVKAIDAHLTDTEATSATARFYRVVRTAE
ncbi:MAG: vanadium-dependent haloperoxidase [Verrucomicrobiales bacterium]|nr:vanadium-dependent haloperoxidase [Verrucomicrobiales bacterium]